MSTIPYGYIYGLRCKENGKWYIGQTTQEPYLYIKTEYQYRKITTRHKIANAIKKYGFSNFDICLLDSAFNKEDLDALEGSYMAEYDSIKNGYNIREAGSRGKPSKESIEKQRNSLKEHWKTNKHPWIGKHHSEESKRKISESNKGRVKSEETLMKMSIAMTGRIVSDEQKIKQSNAMTGREYTEEHCENIRKSVQLRGGNKGSSNPNAKVVTVVNRNTGEKHIGILKELAYKLGFNYCTFIKNRKTSKYIQEEVNNVISN